MKIYTGIGDNGQTMLQHGVYIPKINDRVKTIGAVDELNAAIGLVRSSAGTGTVSNELKMVQDDLFNIGAWLSDPDADNTDLKLINLETRIDSIEKMLPPLKNFILPGGTISSAHAHMARTICRRVEIQVLEGGFDDQAIRVYMNRLSDYLFVVARHLNNNGSLDVKWVSKI